VVAGGSGRRFGGPKQFLPLAGLPVAAWSVRAARSATDGVVLVVPAATGGDTSPHGADLPVPGATGDAALGASRVVAGGATRADSVRAGLAAVPAEAQVIVISDAAHPLATSRLYQSVIAAVRNGADGAVPGMPLTDAVKAVLPDDLAGETTPAGGHVSAQMPMAFRAAALRQAHRHTFAAVEDSSMITADGGRVVIVPGEVTNVHVTTPAELRVAGALMSLVNQLD